MDVKFCARTSDFQRIPGYPIAYWLSAKEKAAFDRGKSLDNYSDCCTGMQTGDNSKYIRLWSEVVIGKTQILNNEGKWFRYNCGGEPRKWYGNYLNIVNWENNGFAIRNEKSSVIRNEKFFFKKGITWKRISGSSFSFRVLPSGFIFDQAGDSMFPINSRHYYFILSFVNSKVAFRLSECISPTLNLTSGNMIKLPVIMDDSQSDHIRTLSEQCVRICKADWDSFEEAWDFKKHPLIKQEVPINAQGGYHE